MYEPIELTKTCYLCHTTYKAGEYHVCKSSYDRGYEAGRRSVKPAFEPIELRCSTCGESYSGVHVCPELLKSDYERGFDAGKADAKRQFGFDSQAGFSVVGK